MTLTKTTDYIKKNIRVALYIRVSTQEQAKEGYSIGEQTDRLKKFADAHGWTIVKIYTDAGHSGANQERPALQDMIEDIKEGRIDKVAVYKLDRLSRSQKDTLELIEDVMLKNGCDFESMTEKFDTATSFGRAMVGILAVFAQLEREQIKERMSLGSEARIKEGKWRGGAHVPFGYDYEAALEKLVINEYEAMIVKHIFEAFISGSTFYSIEKEMKEKGQSFNNSGNTSNRTIKYVLENKNDISRRFFVRMSGCMDAMKEAVLETFGMVQFVNADVTGEFGFVTELMPEGTYEEKAKAYEDKIVGMIRVEG